MNNNSLAFIALCNEYCASLEKAQEKTRKGFVDEMLRLLPRIYISAHDLQAATSGSYIDSALEEDSYNAIRHNLEIILGEQDTYLEVFEEDMKYSDTPISADISENLADLYQVFYNFLNTARYLHDDPESMDDALCSIYEDFHAYWGQTLCNVLRPLNAIDNETDDDTI